MHDYRPLIEGKKTTKAENTTRKCTKLRQRMEKGGISTLLTLALIKIRITPESTNNRKERKKKLPWKFQVNCFSRKVG